MCITIDCEAAFAAQQLIDGHVSTFSFYIPQGLVQPAQGVVQDGPVAPVGAGIGVLPHVLYIVDVPALGKRIEVFIDGSYDRQRPLIEGGASEAVQARLARLDFDYAEAYARRSGQDGLDVGDFQSRQSLRCV